VYRTVVPKPPHLSVYVEVLVGIMLLLCGVGCNSQRHSYSVRSQNMCLRAVTIDYSKCHSDVCNGVVLHKECVDANSQAELR